MKISLRDNNRDKDIPIIDADILFNYERKEKYCYITSFFAINENVGNGSILIDYLFKVLKKLDIKKVIGKLGPRDSENFDKLEYFYKKNGFKVTFSTNKKDGGIKKLL